MNAQLLPDTVYLRRQDGTIIPVRHQETLERCLKDGFVRVDQVDTPKPLEPAATKPAAKKE